MRRFLGMALWMIGCAICIAPAVAFWQSRDSGYNVSVGGASFTGTGDVVSAFNAWWSPGIGYSAAYAAPGTNPAADVCDSGGTNCITLRVGTNGLVPAPSATACAGNPCVSISKLYDQSGASYCTGPCDLTQATNASRPLLLTNCGGGGNMLCVNFTSAGFVLNGPTLTAIAQPFTVSGVIKTGTAALPGDNSEVLTTPCSSLWGIGDDTVSSPEFQMSSGTSFKNSITKLTTSTNFALTGVYNGASGVSSVNGTQTTANAGASSWTGGITALGFAGCFTGTKWQGQVLEVGIKGTPAFTGTQITNVTAQQRTNWGF